MVSRIGVLLDRQREYVGAALAAAALHQHPAAVRLDHQLAERQAQCRCSALVRRGVLVRSFHARGGRLADRLRITIGTRGENDRALEALAGWRS